MLANIQKKFDLSDKNTMALPVIADFYCAVESAEQLPELLQFIAAKKLPSWILGGGSNVLFDATYPGVIIHMCNRGIEVVSENSLTVNVRVSAGEIWDEFLQTCLKQGWHGLENLAIIPGTVGAAPVQNIGAYAQEVADCIVNVYCIDRKTYKSHCFTKEQCQFSYRDSVFKTAEAGRYIIIAVEFELKKDPNFNLSYKPLAEHVDGKEITAQSVRDAVIHIRQSKLPPPDIIANTGSFFKNPVVEKSHYLQLKKQFTDIPGFEVGDKIKLAAGWLIEQSGWKGKSLACVAMYEKQALVLVNNGGASLQDVYRLRDQVQGDVWAKFAVQLEQEPVVVKA